MSFERLMERQSASKRLNQLLTLRETVGQNNEWLNAEISELESFLREKEEQPV